MTDDYNHKHFPLDMDDPLFERFPFVLRVGQQAPDGDVTDLASGSNVRLSGHWRQSPVMIEFGSVT